MRQHHYLPWLWATLALLTLLVGLSVPARAVHAAEDGFPVAPPADTAGLRVSDYFVKSSANPKDFPNNSRISTAYPQALVVTESTDSSLWPIGGLWSKSKIDLNSPFIYTTAHYFGKSMATAADGMTFVLQNDPAGQGAYGSPAGGLGAYPWSSAGAKTIYSNYIQNALAIEMDSYDNDSNVKDDQFDSYISPAPVHGHLGVVRPGETPLTTVQSRNVSHLQVVPLDVDLANDTWKNFTVTWTPKVTYNGGTRILGGTLTYSLTNSAPGVAMPSVTTASYDVANVMTTFKSDHVYYGYTGATGPTMTFQAVAVTKVPQSAKPVTVRYQTTTGTTIAADQSIAGEPGTSWDASTRRSEWLLNNGTWYHYAGTYTADTPDGLDRGQFDEVHSYTVTYQYTPVSDPASAALSKRVRNATTGSAWGTTASANAGDVVEFTLDYANLTGMGTGTLQDILDPVLTYNKGSLKLADDATGWAYQTIDDSTFESAGRTLFPYTLAQGQGFSLRFATTVGQPTTETVTNIATAISGATTLTSNPVTLTLPMGKPFVIHKRAAEDPSKGLAGAAFKLEGDGDTQTLTTDATGEASLKPTAQTATLTLSETTAPSGYDPLADAVELNWDKNLGVTGVRAVGTTAWQTTSPDGMVTVNADGTVTVLDAQPGEITVREYDRTTNTLLTSATYHGRQGKRLSEVVPGANLPGTHDDLMVWGSTFDPTMPPPTTLDPYTPTNPPDPTFSATPTVLTYVYDREMFVLDPDPSLDFGDYDQTATDRDYVIGEHQTTTQQPLPFGATIIDRLGITNWQVSVQQDGQFENDGTALTDARLWFKNLRVHSAGTNSGTLANYQFALSDAFTLDPAGTPQSLLSASAVTEADGLNEYQWRLEFGTLSTGGTSVGLRVPRTTARLAGQYTTTLTWQAAALP